MKNDKPFYILILFFVLFSFSNLYSSPGDTTWVTAYNQELHNWADVHYKKVYFPDTSHHYSKIVMKYTIGCPAGGCDPWDRFGCLRVIVDTNTYYEIARVITPYNIVGTGYPGTCTYEYDLTDYMPLLHDSVKFGNYIETWINNPKGWLATIKFALIEGEVQPKPFKVVNLWQNQYLVYGDTANPPSSHLLPKDVTIDPNTYSVKARIITTGHGQGNTENAAEFSVKQHGIIVGNDTLTYYLWRYDCMMNTCSPQGGTWSYPRAGWCPGASVIPWDTTITSYVTPGQSKIYSYYLDPYVNYCRPTNPNCVSGVTCTDCNYNSTGHTEPFYRVETQLIYYKVNPYVGVLPINSFVPNYYNLEQNFPNPFNPSTTIRFAVKEKANVKMSVFDAAGKLVNTMFNRELTPGTYKINFDGSKLSSGIYFYRLEAFDSKGMNVITKKMVLIK
jgi:hypothetical protein